MSLDTRSKYNRIVLYSTSKKIKIVNNKELIKLCGTGGYFLLSTPFGVMNDSDARKLKTGGILLLGIF
jgi:ribosomal protein S8